MNLGISYKTKGRFCLRTVRTYVFNNDLTNLQYRTMKIHFSIVNNPQKYVGTFCTICFVSEYSFFLILCRKKYVIEKKKKTDWRNSLIQLFYYFLLLHPVYLRTPKSMSISCSTTLKNAKSYFDHLCNCMGPKDRIVYGK